jgi:cobaltochelatase CobT
VCFIKLAVFQHVYDRVIKSFQLPTLHTEYFTHNPTWPNQPQLKVFARTKELSMSNILRSLQTVASAYGDKYGVNVIPSNYAATDGKNIYTVIDEKNPEATWGFLTHESAHIKYTNFEVTKPDALTSELQKHDELKCFSYTQLFSVLNALEDNRIEYNFFQEYCGAFNTFNSMNEKLINEKLWKHEQTTDVVQAIFSFLMLYCAGSANGMNYPSCRELSRQSSDNLKLLVVAETYTKLEELVLASIDCETTELVVDLSIEVLKVLVKLKNDDKSQDSDSQSSDDKSGRTIDLKNIPNIKDKGDLIATVLENSLTKEAIDCGAHHAHVEHDIPVGNFINRFQKGVDSAGKLIRKVNNLIESKSRTKKVILQRGRKISRRKVALIPTGKRSVFERNIDGIKSNTALYVSTDISGSMGQFMKTGKGGVETDKSRLEVALESLSALIYSVDRNKGSSISLTAFDHEIYKIKTFDETISKAKKVINKIKTHGRTTLAPSIHYGVKELSKVQSKHSRFVMVIITDGLPTDSNDAKVLIERIKKSKIEVFGIGIDIDTYIKFEMENIFGTDCFIIINDPEELQNEIMNIAHIAL